MDSKATELEHATTAAATAAAAAAAIAAAAAATAAAAAGTGAGGATTVFADATAEEGNARVSSGAAKVNGVSPLAAAGDGCVLCCPMFCRYRRWTLKTYLDNSRFRCLSLCRVLHLLLSPKQKQKTPGCPGVLGTLVVGRFRSSRGRARVAPCFPWFTAPDVE